MAENAAWVPPLWPGDIPEGHRPVLDHNNNTWGFEKLENLETLSINHDIPMDPNPPLPDPSIMGNPNPPFPYGVPAAAIPDGYRITPIGVEPIPPSEPTE